MFKFFKTRLQFLAAVLAALCLVGTFFFYTTTPLQATENSVKELFFTILHTNDEHSSVIPHSPAVDFHPELDDPTVGGYARLATAVKEIRNKKEKVGEPVLLLSGGDFIGGSSYSWLVPRGLLQSLL